MLLSPALVGAAQELFETWLMHCSSNQTLLLTLECLSRTLYTNFQCLSFSRCFLSKILHELYLEEECCLVTTKTSRLLTASACSELVGTIKSSARYFQVKMEARLPAGTGSGEGHFSFYTVFFWNRVGITKEFCPGGLLLYQSLESWEQDFPELLGPRLTGISWHFQQSSPVPRLDR